MCIQDVAILGVMPHFFSIADFLQKLFHTTDELMSLCDEYSDQPFKKKFTETFISVVDNLLDDEN